MHNFLTLYRTLTVLSAPILKALLHRRLQHGKEDAVRLSERIGQPSLPRPTGKLLWVHCASVGELLSVIPLLNILLEQKPDWQALITTGTVTSAALFAEQVKNLPAGRVIHQFIPLDHPAWVKRFLNHWQPDAVLWLESELWPNWLQAIKTRHIPSLLLNARMRPKTARTWQFLKREITEMLSGFTAILTGSRDFVALFKQYGAKDVSYIGNIKLANPAPGVDATKLADLCAIIGDRLCIGCLQSHPTDEPFVAENIMRLKADFPTVLNITVPRHAKRGPEIASELNAMGLNVALRSNGEPITSDTDVYIADTMGEMGLWYSLCEFGVIGGSFFPFGGQNPFEGTHDGCIPVYGPHMFNFKALTECVEERHVSVSVPDRDALYPALFHLLQQPQELRIKQIAAKELATESGNILPQTADYIIKTIMPS